MADKALFQSSAVAVLKADSSICPGGRIGEGIAVGLLLGFGAVVGPLVGVGSLHGEFVGSATGGEKSKPGAQ